VVATGGTCPAPGPGRAPHQCTPVHLSAVHGPPTQWQQSMAWSSTTTVSRQTCEAHNSIVGISPALLRPLSQATQGIYESSHMQQAHVCKPYRDSSHRTRQSLTHTMCTAHVQTLAGWYANTCSVYLYCQLVRLQLDGPYDNCLAGLWLQHRVLDVLDQFIAAALLSVHLL
jgi:hypothetical protein